MKSTMLAIFTVWAVMIGSFWSVSQAQIYHTTPDWISVDEKFTMSVALGDLDLDGNLDLVSANYKYPYTFDSGTPEAIGTEGDYGDILGAYQWLEGQGQFGDLVEFNGGGTAIPHRCWDCVALGDADNDGDLDLLAGYVASDRAEGRYGGFSVYINQRIVNNEPQALEFNELFSGGVPIGIGGGDIHCVRWVDYNRDGFLDIAALNVARELSIYRNLFPDNGNSGPWFALIDSDSISFIFYDGVLYPTITTMEFGDINSDDGIDLYINFPGQVNVFKFDTQAAANNYSFTDPARRWICDFKESQFCASFGHYAGNLALAIGSFDFTGNDESVELQPWRNDIYTFNPTSNQLDHAWQSQEQMFPQSSEIPYTQLVTDIQWANLDETGALDLVTSSYPVCKSIDNVPDWDYNRGREFYYLNPQYPGGTRAWQTAQPDLSTSLALGDIDGSHVIANAVEEFLDETDHLLYVQHYPLVSVDTVSYYNANGTRIAVWFPHWDPFGSLPDFDCCFDPVNGWISIDKDEAPQGAVRIEVEYKYSTALDLAIGNDGANAVYFHNAGGAPPTYPVPLVHEIPSLLNNPVYQYNQDHFIVENPQGQVDLMMPQAVGANFNGFSSTYHVTPYQIHNFLNNHPSIRCIDIGAHWPSIEMFQGHFFWGGVDQILIELEQFYETNKCTPILFTDGSPLWTQGNRTNSQDLDPQPRTCSEKLYMMYMRALVNRYRPSGVIKTFDPNQAWGDWGVTMFQLMNEPEGMYSDYRYCSKPPSTNDDVIKDVAEKMYRNYQIVKQISDNVFEEADSLKVISPNWAICTPAYFYSDPPELNPWWQLYVVPSFPYINAVDNTELNQPDIPSTTNILWNYTDFISQQMYCGQNNLSKVRIDPYHPATTAGKRVGIEHAFWGYYTEGIQDYVQDPTRNWSPPLKDDESNWWSVHPFFVYEWSYECDWGGQPDDQFPKKDWTAAQLAEEFSIDVFPDDPNKDYRLLTYDVSCNDVFWLGDTAYWDVYDNVANHLNDMSPDPYTGTHVKWLEYEAQATNPPTDPDVYRYTYQYHVAPTEESDHYVHFLKTDWDLGANPGNLYVNDNQNGWDFQDLQFTYAFPGTPKVDCYTPEGDHFQKDVVGSPSQGVHFAPGEMGPATLIMRENSTASQTNYDQSISLHLGWNLVSWQIILPDSTPQTYLRMDDVLPDIDDNYWFFFNGSYNGSINGHIYRWLKTDESYAGSGTPPPETWEWDLNYAYYLLMDVFDANWAYTDKERLPLSNFEITPDPAWDDLDELSPEEYVNGWFFMGYAPPGYTKLATVYQSWEPPNGSTASISYRGPFHDLYWDGTVVNHPHFDRDEQYLVIVKADDGKMYLPYDLNNGHYPSHGIDQEYDEIGTLQPGRGYFLGFREATTQMEFDGWAEYPGWPTTASVQPGLENNLIMTAAATHFQYNTYTHWFYPVFIDTVDLEITPMVSGDEIGVFDGERCVGAAAFTGEFPMKITCWKDNIATPNLLDGYQAGQEMIFVWYDASTNQEITFTPPPTTNSLEEDPIVATHSGFGAGMYAIRSLAYGAQSILQLPQAFKLSPNFPNPFNAETIIPLELPERSHVKIELFNVRGQSCGVIFNGVQNAGWPKLRVNAAQLPSGVYFFRVAAEGLERNGKFTAAGKMLVLK